MQGENISGGKLTALAVLFTLLFFIVGTVVLGQAKNDKLKMISEYSSDNTELRDILQFEGIEYFKLQFIGQELKNKSYKITVKEIWNGKVVKDTIVFDSKLIGIKQFENVNDTVLHLRVISKLVRNKLRMSFKFPRFLVKKEYDAVANGAYSLRNIAYESKLPIVYNKKFYLLAYILPYERKDGSQSWCEVATSGEDVEKWGEKFGIKHYLLFEMKFE